MHLFSWRRSFKKRRRDGSETKIIQMVGIKIILFFISFSLLFVVNLSFSNWWTQPQILQILMCFHKEMGKIKEIISAVKTVKCDRIKDVILELSFMFILVYKDNWKYNYSHLYFYLLWYVYLSNRIGQNWLRCGRINIF